MNDLLHLHPLLPRLHSRLQEPLPGLPVQLEMAPPYRGDIMPPSVPPNARPCAVLLLLYLHQGELHTVLMRRTEDGMAHSGQVSLPGGGREPQDPDFVATALREAEEELGIPAPEVHPIGMLTEIYIPPSNSLVYPVVGVAPRRPAFVPDPVEVAHIIEAPLPMLRHPSTRRSEPMRIRQTTVQMPVFDVQGHIVWGATAMMLREFLRVVEQAEV